MADRENRDYDDAEGSLDPELLYTKEYCIGRLPRAPAWRDNH
jgi:serine/threonine-protein kinase 24/25/MST4